MKNKTLTAILANLALVLGACDDKSNREESIVLRETDLVLPGPCDKILNMGKGGGNYISCENKDGTHVIYTNGYSGSKYWYVNYVRTPRNIVIHNDISNKPMDCRECTIGGGK